MSKVHSANSWSIDYSAEKKCVYVSTNDYHADPLTLSTAQLRNMLQILDPTDKPVTPSADLQAVKTPTSPFYGISKKEKTFYIVIPEGWSGLLEFTRVDLYKFAGTMNKRVKAGKKPKQINPCDMESPGSRRGRNAVSRALHSFMAALSQEQATLSHGPYSLCALMSSGHRLVNAGYKREVTFIEGASGSCRRGLHLIPQTRFK